MTKTVAVMMVFVFVVAAIVGGGVAYRLKPSAEVHVSVTIEEIRKIAQLATVEYTVTGYARQLFESRFIGPKPVPTDYVFSYVTAKITGSVDLDKATIDVQKGGDTPHVSIHFKRGSIKVEEIVPARTPDIDNPGQFIRNPDTVSARSEIKGVFLFSPAGQKELDMVEALAFKHMKKAALASDIVEKTKENAKIILSGFVGSLGYGATITFDENAYDPAQPDK
jgi:hypothetical protein